MTLQDRAIESDKEVIRLASLLTEAQTLLADLEVEAALMLSPALTNRIEAWRGKEWSEEGGIHDSGFLYWMHRSSETLRPKCVVCRQDNTCFPGRYYEGNPPVPESVVAAVRASLPVTENTE